MALVGPFIVTCYDNQVKPSIHARRGRPPSGKALSAAERMRSMRARRKASGLKPVTRWVVEGPPVGPHSDHRQLDIRSLAMHAAIAQKITRNPELLNVARANLRRWGKRWGRATPTWHGEWQAILKRPWSEIAALITDGGELATRLRQSSPFAGVLSHGERKRIYDAFRA
jgi:hypothetical protein